MAKTKRKKRQKSTKYGKVELETTLVPNPDWRADLDGVKGFPREIRATVNMRESPIVWMLSHGHVSESQARAANHFRRLYEMTGGADLKAMDYLREPVDGGRFADIITDRKAVAAKELAEAYRVLGPGGYSLVMAVCGQCIWIKDLEATKRKQWEAGKTLKDCLDVLAVHWGYETRGMRVWRAAS